MWDIDLGSTRDEEFRREYAEALELWERATGQPQRPAWDTDEWRQRQVNAILLPNFNR